MVKVMRKIGVSLAAFILSVFAAALGQRAFEIVFPILSDGSMMQIGGSTWFGFLLFAVFFFAVGYVVPRWLESRWALAWLLWPLAALYAFALIQQPELYGYFQFQSPVFYVIQGPFLISGVAMIVGYLYKSLSRKVSRHAT